MPKKATLDDVKLFLKENDINHECELLSNEYVNSSTPLLFKCNVCGNKFERDFSHVKRKRFRCPTCGRSSGGGNNKSSIDAVQTFLKENDINHECELLSTEYIDSITPLKFRCNVCGNIFERDFNHIKRKRFRCPQCGITAGARKIEYTKEDVQKRIWQDRQYVLIGEYINAGTKVKCKCSKGHIFDLVFSQFLNGSSGCKQCANENLRGSNHWNWQNGGHQEVTDYFRHRLLPWKRSCLNVAGFRCNITGSSQDLVVHHLFNFSDIMHSVFNDLNIPIKNHISEYTEKEREILATEILKRHTLNSGVVLTNELHKQFHSIYGLFNNTKEQYLQFKDNYLNNKI